MDVSTMLAVAGLVAVNVVGWLITYGRLAEKVSRNSDLLTNGLSEKVQQIGESVAKNDGLAEEVHTLTKDFAGLKGTVLTFMDMSREKTKS